jgi:hypothetical protein
VNQTKRSGENSRPKSLSSHFQWFHSEKNEIGSKSIRPLVPRWRAAVAGPLPGMLGVWPTPRGFPLMSKAVHTRVKLYAASPLDAPAVKISIRFQAVPLSQEFPAPDNVRGTTATATSHRFVLQGDVVFPPAGSVRALVCARQAG